MLKMMMESGDTKQLMALTEVPAFVLEQFCDLILRKQDLRNPDVRYMLRETVNALKVKAEEPPDGPVAFERHSLKEQLVYVEGLLDEFDQNDG